MSYIALYRKYRPIKFSDIVGQTHISEILKNQIINNRIGHAYLFSGIRGTGKTTSAKIFARAINCLNPQNGEPCNECEICKAILDGSLTDVTEIDAASNNSVENIRDIREEVMYLPTKAKYRVYIIDEVHMLSTGAFNALLKTLEEPPSHVKFILATTEPNKLPATILSRCQRFDFKRISNEDIVSRLKYILDSIGKTAQDEALEIIAHLSDGALRDAISILDRCVNDTDNITTEYIRELLGIPDDIVVLEILENIINNDAENLILNFENILNSGNNSLNILEQLIKKCRDLVIYVKTKKIEIYNEEAKNKLESISKNVSIEKIVNIISRMSQLQNNAKWSNNQDIVIEAGLLSLCVSTEYDNLDDIRNRIERLEENIASGNIKTNQIKENKEEKKKAEEKKDLDKKEEIVEKEEKVIEKQSEKEEQPKEEVIVDNKIAESWKDILTKLREIGKVQLFTNLVNSTAKNISDDVIGIYFKADFAKMMVEKNDNIDILKQVITEITGIEYEIRCFLEKDKKEDGAFNKIKEKANELNIPIDVIDE